MTSAGAASPRCWPNPSSPRVLADGVRLVHWLVYPTNLASIAFSRTVFPEADETYPPEDKAVGQFRAFSLNGTAATDAPVRARLLTAPTP